MRIAITGGTGFIGSHLTARLIRGGHEPILIARHNRASLAAGAAVAGATMHAIGLEDRAALTQAFAGCEAVVHCAGINREIGTQTYQRIHVEGTRNVVEAARAAGVARIALTSFLRARPNCGSGYHHSKWEAEEVVRQSGLSFTVLKPGVTTLLITLRGPCSPFQSSGWSASASRECGLRRLTMSRGFWRRPWLTPG